MDQHQSHDEAEVRLANLNALRNGGIDPYPASVERTHTAAEAALQFTGLEAERREITLVGRILAIRLHGGSCFVVIRDGTGRFQLYLTKDALPEGHYEIFVARYNVADFVQATGTLFVTKKGEQTLKVSSLRMLAKTLLPLPDKWHGIKDTEERFRKRYLDIIMNDDVRDRFVTRSKIISALRTFLDTRGFLEVETPTLQPIYGGGFARPFVTHHNTLGADLYLCISDEMYLKRLIVAGYERVYEIYKAFRNEGIDTSHNPEFTMWEAQIAFQDYRFGMDLIEEIFESIALSVLGKTSVPFKGHQIQLARPWRRMRLVDAVREVIGEDPLLWQSLKEAQNAARSLSIPANKKTEIERMGKIGEIIAFVFEELVEPTLIQPTIVYDYPVEVSPLAKKCPDPRFTERFEFFVCGSELGNNYSELNDPLDLEKRFIEEKDREKAGFAEAHQTDYDYLEALKHGFPPTCGVAIGIDRMAMLFTDAPSIKEVIFFPTLRPKTARESAQNISKAFDQPNSMSPQAETHSSTLHVNDRDDALSLLRQHVKSENLIKHMIAAEAVMRALAVRFNEDEERWALAGLLHDLDWEETQHAPEQHSIKAQEYLLAAGIDPVVRRAIYVHNHMHGVDPESLLEKALYTAEELTGFIVACALVQPDRKLASLSADSILKKFKQPSFAKGVNRDIVMKAENMLGISLSELIQIELDAMKEISEELGL